MSTDTDTVIETLGGALVRAVRTEGVVNDRCWQDKAPKSPTFPYCTVIDAITTGPALRGDGRTLMLERLMQLDLWERLDEEDQRVVRRLAAAVDGARVQVGDGWVRLTVLDTQRLVEEANNIVHRALTITAKHDPTAL